MPNTCQVTFWNNAYRFSWADHIFVETTMRFAYRWSRTVDSYHFSEEEEIKRERDREREHWTYNHARGWCILAFHVCFHLNGNRVHNVIVFARKPGLTAAAPTRYCLHCSPLTNNPPAFQLHRNLSLHLLCSRFDILPHCNSKRKRNAVLLILSLFTKWVPFLKADKNIIKSIWNSLKWCYNYYRHDDCYILTLYNNNFNLVMEFLVTLFSGFHLMKIHWESVKSYWNFRNPNV